MKTGRHSDYVNAAPIQAAMREVYKIEGRNKLAARIWPEATEERDSLRRLESVMLQKQLSFDLADRILCVLNKVSLWRAEPALEYEDINLSLVDVRSPTCEATRREVLEGIVEARKTMSIENVARKFGVGNVLIRQYLEEAGVTSAPTRPRWCKQGHDTHELGRYRDGGCAQCKRDQKARKRAQRRELVTT